MSKLSYPLSLSAEELRTRELFNTVDWSPMNAVIGQVFVAHHTLSLPVEDIARLCTQEQHPERLPGLKKALTALVRSKVLRSRAIHGKTHYEVNY